MADEPPFNSRQTCPTCDGDGWIITELWNEMDGVTRSDCPDCDRPAPAVEPPFDCREPGYTGPMYQGVCHPCRMCARCVREMEERAEREGWNG